MAALTTPRSGASSDSNSGLTPAGPQPGLPVGSAPLDAGAELSRERPPVGVDATDAERVTRANAHDLARKKFPAAQLQQMERLVAALRQVMASRSLSERALARELGVTLGTTHKYFTYQVLPGRVTTDIMANLARLLGVTVDALLKYFETGVLDSGIGRAEVETWLRSNASSEHLGWMFEALSAAANAGRLHAAPVTAQAPTVYDWPITALRGRGLDDGLRERMGLGDEALRALAVDGVFDQALVDSFALAMGLDPEAVHGAFLERRPCEPPVA